MNGKRTPGRSLDEWLELVTSCRQSGLTDAAWCHENGISPCCFYNAVSRLRKRACEIPEPSGKASTLDFTSHKQDVVQIAIEPEHTPAELVSMEKNCSLYLDNSHTIEIEANGNHKHLVRNLPAAGCFIFIRKKTACLSRNAAWHTRMGFHL